MLMRTLVAGLLAALMLTGCDAAPSSPADGDSDADITEQPAESDPGDTMADEDPDTHEEDFPQETEDFDAPEQDEEAPDPASLARVFAVNPVTTPEPVEVALDGVADDADGSLVSALDAGGCRLLRVVSCIDAGATNTINMGQGPFTQRICTLKPRADKVLNGSFIYTDWDNARNGVFDAADVHAEVELYYHARRMYDFLTGPQINLWPRLPGRHDRGDECVPLLLVANYQLPTKDGDALAPLSMAMFIPEEYRSQGMGAVYGLEGYQGDALVFGQGPRADFAYDGETVYHEFGHWVNYALAGLTHETAFDQYGFSNMGSALEQGLAETFVFLVSGRTRFFEYLDAVAGPGFVRGVTGGDTFPASLRGFDQSDGLIVAGANYEAFQALADSRGVTAGQFGRCVLRTLTLMGAASLPHDFAAYADTLADVVSSELGADQAETVRGVMTGRGLYETRRVKDATTYQEGDHQALYVGGALAAAWNTTMVLGEPGGGMRVATAVVQLLVRPAEGTQRVRLSAALQAMPDVTGQYPDDYAWDPWLFVRYQEPVHLEKTGSAYQATRDLAVEAEIVPADEPGGPPQAVTFVVETGGDQRPLHLLLLNRGDAPFALRNLAVTREP